MPLLCESSMGWLSAVKTIGYEVSIVPLEIQEMWFVSNPTNTIVRTMPT